MPAGIRAEVRIADPPDCPVVDAAAAAGGRARSVATSVNPDTPERVTAEFLLETDTPFEELDLDPALSPVFAYGSSTAIRFERQLDSGCPCEAIERFDCPITDVRAEGSTLHLTFHAPNMERLRSILGELADRYTSFDVERLLHSQQEHGGETGVFVDRSQLTDRQREVLQTAHRMGYFERPKRANAGEVADALDISGSTVAEHLAAAQTKLFDAILDNQP
ncbi:helix-turn-helix domain-containing protein [Halobacteria archaeon AArc-dxtr1]|nr:helix-turn-helix domain-containing protein [Halobacteria archaeon AArc-dxtr1]